MSRWHVSRVRKQLVYNDLSPVTDDMLAKTRLWLLSPRLDILCASHRANRQSRRVVQNIKKNKTPESSKQLVNSQKPTFPATPTKHSTPAKLYQTSCLASSNCRRFLPFQAPLAFPRTVLAIRNISLYPNPNRLPPLPQSSLSTLHPSSYSLLLFHHSKY